MVHRAFRQRWIGALTKFFKTCIGVLQAQFHKFLQPWRKLCHFAALGELSNAHNLIDGGFGTFRLVRDFRVHLAVDFIAHTLAHTLVFHGERTLMCANKCQEF